MTRSRPAELEGGWQALRSSHFGVAEQVFRDRLADEEVRAEAYEGLSWVAWYRDDAALAIEARERAFAGYRLRGDDVGAARVALWLGVCHLEFRGDEAVAQGWFARAADLLASHPSSAEHGWMSLHEAAMAVEGAADARTARQVGGEVAALAQLLADPDLEHVARSVEGLGLVLEGEVTQGMRQLGAAAAAALTDEVSEPVLKGWVCCYAIYGCEAVGEYDKAAEWCKHALALSERVRMAYLRRVCRCHYAAALVGSGEWAQAERELVEAIAALEASRPGQAVEGIVRLGDLRRRQGAFDEALRLYASAEGHPLALLGRAAIAIERGELDAAVAHLEKALRRTPAHNKAGRLAALDLLVEAHLARDDLERATEATEELESLATLYGTRHFGGIARRRRGELRLHGGDCSGARDDLEEALELFRAGQAVYEVAATRISLARALVALHDPSSAREQAQAAATEAERLGARSLWARARAVVHGTDPGEPLSSREHQVLRLIGEGLTDRMIATQLQLSEHTVHRHVANIRTKLGVGSRAAAVAHLRARGSPGH